MSKGPKTAAAALALGLPSSVLRPLNTGTTHFMTRLIWVMVGSLACGQHVTGLRGRLQHVTNAAADNCVSATILRQRLALVSALSMIETLPSDEAELEEAAAALSAFFCLTGPNFFEEEEAAEVAEPEGAAAALSAFFC